MAVVDLKARPRAGRGKGYRNRLKQNGLIPAVIYGKEVGSLLLEVETRAVQDILTKTGRNALIQLRVEPEKGRAKKYDAIIKDVHMHPYKNEFFHVDFHQISLKDELTTSVNLKLTGSAPGVTAGGRLEQLIRQVEVSCLPRNIPDHIEVDVSGLGIGDAIHVSDLKAPEGVKFETDGDVTVVTLIAPHREEEKAPEETGEAAPAPTPETGQ
ncbi:50S ribosomal protein L25 [Candidatus Desulforudis audaxviator]|uniref:Large ribosomal subunit protein bL25 n=1 Tax=Desulforudis audaxviator (strain MP104C) TaxID=477974 RepID=RL25_DESAP|nr:50S ribosomal protein L25 [Candidatus Desulforudis audaxviator]B1I196.1 RecName: Full=Large ribosomal subunit protein bL25; AltName: Full=50S ribosomal protein L25; AltName: Full=General stress protein CTC [Candidatus Desulforudis audaxviator MP104C]ACA58638.1 ribosomal 5S rRNA E-loop binding protein Ctc/L25/TL5 [Candidatus Desulforudis audaxviator MP104C]AZK58636.1 LSU ribosomal protein L25p [Candidatus Desulforudis audaxviator]